MRGPGGTPSAIRCRPRTSGGGARVLDAERARALEEPVHRRAIERAGAAVAVGLREARQQLEVDFLRQAPERAVARPASVTS